MKQTETAPKYPLEATIRPRVKLIYAKILVPQSKYCIEGPVKCIACYDDTPRPICLGAIGGGLLERGKDGKPLKSAQCAALPVAPPTYAAGEEPGAKCEWKAEKKWQRKGGNVQHFYGDGSSFIGFNLSFSGPGTYEIVPTSRKERLGNLKVYQKNGGEVQAKPKKRMGLKETWTTPREVKTGIKFSMWQLTDKKLKYRKTEKF